MMVKNKRLRLLLLYPICLVLIIFLVQACCERKEKLTGKGQLSHYSLVDTLSAMDTIRGPFAMNVFYERNIIGEIQDPIACLSATTCAIDFVNPLDPASFQLTLNTPIFGMNDTLAAGSDLFILTSIERNIDTYYSTASVFFNSAFMDDYTIPDGHHEIVISGMTQDGIALSDTLSIDFNL